MLLVVYINCFLLDSLFISSSFAQGLNPIHIKPTTLFHHLSNVKQFRSTMVAASITHDKVEEHLIGGPMLCITKAFFIFTLL